MAFFSKDKDTPQTTADTASSNSADTSSSGGKRTSGISTIIIFLVIVVIYFMANQMYKENDISWSTIQKDALEDTPAPTEFYTDESGNYLTETEVIENAVNKFYSRTGVSAYIYVLEDDESLESASELYDITHELYDELFDDEYHFLIVMCNNGEEFLFNYTAGEEALAVVDETEGMQIVDDCIGLYFDEDDIPATLAKAIKRAAAHIMQAGNLGFRIVIIVAIVVAAVIYLIVRYKKNGGHWKAEEKTADGRTIIRFKK